LATQEQTIGSKQILQAMEAVNDPGVPGRPVHVEQGLGAQQISDAINRIQKITEDNVNVSVEMDVAEITLREKGCSPPVGTPEVQALSSSLK